MGKFKKWDKVKMGVKQENIKDEGIKQEYEVKEEPEIKQEHPRVNLSALWLNYKPRSTQLVRAGGDWISQLASEDNARGFVDINTKHKLKELATQILQNDAFNYSRREASGTRKNDAKFRKTVFSHGTSRDKVAAHVLRCMEAPVHSLSNLNALISMVTPKAKGGYQEVFSAIRELLESTFLPNDQIARKFESHNFAILSRLLSSGREQAEKQLALWYFEDQLAFAYLRLIQQIVQVCQDAVDKTKVHGVRCLAELVSSNPIQDSEGRALAAVVNKLGDPSRRVAAHTMFHIRALLHKQPTLKHKVVEHIEDLLYRCNVSGKAQYYCLCFLKDMLFSRNDQKLASKLIKLYFGFFKACTKKGEVDTRLMGALLRGINRAFPYSQMSVVALDEQLNTLYKICHLVSFPIAAQALQLIYQVTGTRDEVTNRFYQIVYHQLQDPAFGVSTATSAFLNLVFKALVRDTSINRIQAFIKRLLQVSLYMSPNVITGIEYLISEIVKEKPALTTLVKVLQADTMKKTVDDDSDDGLETFSDVDDEEDKAARKDDHTTKTNGTEISDQAGTEMGDKAAKTGVPSSKAKDTNLPHSPKRVSNISPSFDISSSPDKSQSDNDNSSPDTKPDVKPDVKPSMGSSWVHQHNAAHICRVSSYDPFHRNPLYSGAQYTQLWEMGPLKAHYHPSVSLFAGQIVKGECIEYSGDPLQDFTLTRFLEKFVHRNPKKVVEQNDNAGGFVLGRKSQYTPQAARTIPIDSEAFTALQPEEVPADHLFFHKYFTQCKKKIKKKKDEDTESVEDDEFDEYLRRMNGLGNDDDDEIDDDEVMDFASGAKPAKLNAEEDEMDDDDGGGDDDDMDGDEGGDGGDVEDFGGEDDFDGEGEFDGDNDEDDWGDLDEGDMSDLASGDDGIDFDEEGAAFSDEADLEMDKAGKKTKGSAATVKKSKKKGDGGLSSMFASAEDFDHLLEENAEGGMNAITTQAMANKDRAHIKQINWEVDRNRRMKDQPWRNKKQKKGKPGPKIDTIKKVKNNAKFKAKKGPNKFKGKKN